MKAAPSILLIKDFTLPPIVNGAPQFWHFSAINLFVAPHFEHTFFLTAIKNPSI